MFLETFLEKDLSQNPNTIFSLIFEQNVPDKDRPINALKGPLAGVNSIGNYVKQGKSCYRLLPPKWSYQPCHCANLRV